MKLEKVVRNLILGSILACLAHVWAQKDFLWVLSQLLFISDVKHCQTLCVFKENIQTKENGKKTHFVPDLGPLSPNLGHSFFFEIRLCQSEGIMVSYHHIKYQKKLMIQSCLEK